MTDLILFIVFLVAMSFLSGMEMALVSSSKIKVKTIAKERRWWEGFTYKLVKDTPKTLSGILVGSNISLVACSVFTTHLFYEKFQSALGGLNPYYAPLVVTPFLLIFGEIIPKTLFMKSPNRFLITFSPFLFPVNYFLHPISIIIHRMANSILDFLKVEDRKGFFTRKEIELVLRKGEEDGIVKHFEREILTGVINFPDKVVEQSMTTVEAIVAIEKNSSFNELSDLISKSGFSRIPVYDGKIDRITGLIHAKDLLRLEEDENWQKYLREPKFISRKKNLAKLLDEFREEKEQMAIVLDEHRNTVGVITIEDLLEEIVGEIKDEYDK